MLMRSGVSFFFYLLDITKTLEVIQAFELCENEMLSHIFYLLHKVVYWNRSNYHFLRSKNVTTEWRHDREKAGKLSVSTRPPPDQVVWKCLTS